MIPRLVLDTNVLVSHFILPGGNPTKILGLILARKAALLTSRVLLDEVEGVLLVKVGFTSKAARHAREALESVAEVVHPRHLVDDVRADPDDNRVLEVALSGRADVIVSGDKKHLLPLRSFRGMPILAPAEYLKQALF